MTVQHRECPKCADLFNLKWLILYYVTFISICYHVLCIACPANHLVPLWPLRLILSHPRGCALGTQPFSELPSSSESWPSPRIPPFFSTSASVPVGDLALLTWSPGFVLNGLLEWYILFWNFIVWSESKILSMLLLLKLIFSSTFKIGSGDPGKVSEGWDLKREVLTSDNWYLPPPAQSSISSVCLEGGLCLYFSLASKDHLNSFW